MRSGNHPATCGGDHRRLRARRRGAPARGLALMFALIVAAALALASTALITSAQMDARRERETELLFIGKQFSRALAQYHTHAPDGIPVYPERLEDLLEDHRFPMPVRHLRRIWRDPFTGRAEWGLVRAGGRIVGVCSLSDAKPVRRAPPDGEVTVMPTADGLTAGYRNWVFAPRDMPLAPPAAASVPVANP